ncbi:unnamed protein product [Phytophthora lilii]|uniref:Unnamed protein product n=1 Tax=Phytophthora lilii TaxID=2077276 RepID=A0A9W6TBB8_9STRA|nr:unnamed protein product [Phytophthora lilii]
MNEGQNACKRLHDRLKEHFKDLVNMQNNEQLPSSDTLDKHVDIMSKSIHLLLLSDDDVRENLRNGIIPARPENIPDEAWELVISMTNINPTKRVSIGHVVKTMSVLAEKECAQQQQELTETTPASLATVIPTETSSTKLSTTDLKADAASSREIVNLLEALSTGSADKKEAVLFLLSRNVLMMMNFGL